MGEYLPDDVGIFDAGDDLHGSAAGLASLDIDVEHALEALRPGLERYSLADDGMTLKVYMTVTDPVYLTEPIDIDYSMDKQADRELVRAPCSKEGAQLFISGIVRGEVEED